MEARDALELRRQEILSRLTPDTLQLQPGYHTAREELIRPDRLESETAYFWDRWAPRLGPAATVLITRMRQACRRSGVAVEATDSAVTMSYADIGRFCGMSASTIKRLLQEEDVRRFIRKEAQMRSSALGRVDAPNRYLVMMTDPLLSEDAERLRLNLADRVLTDELLGKATPGRNSARVHSAPVPPVHSAPVPRVQNDPVAPDQKDPASSGHGDPGTRPPKTSVLRRRTSRPAAQAESTPDSNMQNVLERERKNVNVLKGEALPYRIDPEVEAWAGRMVELTGDPQSTNFYRKAARILLQRNATAVMDHAIGMVKEAIRQGTARRPGALLTTTLRALAEERGIAITASTSTPPAPIPSGDADAETEAVRQIVRRALLEP